MARNVKCIVCDREATTALFFLLTSIGDTPQVKKNSKSIKLCRRCTEDLSASLPELVANHLTTAIDALVTARKALVKDSTD
jgi:hypothetical protein